MTLSNISAAQFKLTETTAKFEDRATDQIIREVLKHQPPGTARRLVQYLRHHHQQLTLNLLEETWPDFPIKLMAAPPVVAKMSAILQGLKTSKIVNLLEEVSANFPDSPTGVVFDSKSDGLPILVLYKGVEPWVNNWCIEYKLGDDTVYIQTLRGFVDSMTHHWTLPETAAQECEE